MAGISATFIDAYTFSVSGDDSITFHLFRKVQADCGSDGMKYSVIHNVSYNSGSDVTYVTLADSVLTSNLAEVWFGDVPVPGSGRAFPDLSSIIGPKIDFSIPAVSESGFDISIDVKAFGATHSGELTVKSQVELSAKSVIIDIDDNYGASSMGVRSIEFLDQNDNVISLTEANGDFTAIASSSTDSDHAAGYAFDTSLSKTGTAQNSSWSAAQTNNQRLIVNFTNPIRFFKIRVNNFHDSGSNTDAGIRNVDIYTSSKSVSNTTHDGDTSNYIHLGYFTVGQHVSSDEIDNQIVTSIAGGTQYWIDGEIKNPTTLGTTISIINGLNSSTTYNLRCVALDGLNPDIMVVTPSMTSNTIAPMPAA